MTYGKGEYCFIVLFSEPTVTAKSNLVLDVKPWDDETGKFAFLRCSATALHGSITCLQYYPVMVLIGP